MAFTYNGFGTKFYGEAERRPDGSFVTTEWITALYVPVIPIRSFRFVRVQNKGVNVLVYRSEAYAVLEKLPICWPQVGRIYAFVFGAAAWWILMGWLFGAKLKVFDGANAVWWMIPFIAVMVLPFIVVWWARREAYRARHGDGAQPPAA